MRDRQIAAATMGEGSAAMEAEEVASAARTGSMASVEEAGAVEKAGT